MLGLSLFWSIGSESERLDYFGLTQFTLNMLQLAIIFLFNYFIFIPKYLFKGGRVKFFLFNTLLVAALLIITYTFIKSDLLIGVRPLDPLRNGFTVKPLAKDLISYVLMIGLVIAMRLSKRLKQSEEALKEAENAKVKAELDNLRNQINPHFLLNTLNNIYALTTIDTEKAQKTIIELSKLLRYVLYENLTNSVLVSREVEFLKTYIELMSIRLPRKVEIITNFELVENSKREIAPLIFISLIENAFKHSVSSSGDGFIYIHFVEVEDSDEVILSIQNSNHSKGDKDKSGHGIGLEQVKRRLDLLYPNNYIWKIENTFEIYSSELILNRSK